MRYEAPTYPEPIPEHIFIYHSEAEYQMVIKHGLWPFDESTKARVIAWREKQK